MEEKVKIFGCRCGYKCPVPYDFFEDTVENRESLKCPRCGRDWVTYSKKGKLEIVVPVSRKKTLKNAQ